MTSTPDPKTHPRGAEEPDAPRLPKTLAAVFAVLMLALCGLTVRQAAESQALRAENAETQKWIDYYNDHLPRQLMEYDAVAARIPQLREELAALPEKREAAALEKQAAKDERDRVKTGYSNIQKAAEAYYQAALDAQTAQTEAREAYEALVRAIGEEGQP